VGLLPDLELQVVDVLEVVLAEALAPAAAPPLRRRRRRGLVAGRRRRGLRDVHRHRRHRRLGGWGSSCVRGKVSARIAEAVGLLVGLGLAVSPRSALGFIEVVGPLAWGGGSWPRLLGLEDGTRNSPDKTPRLSSETVSLIKFTLTRENRKFVKVR